eukprot:1044416-Prymnesium_polylepis.3
MWNPRKGERTPLVPRRYSALRAGRSEGSHGVFGVVSRIGAYPTSHVSLSACVVSLRAVPAAATVNAAVR